MASMVPEIQVRFRNALVAQPMRHRTAELVRIFSECSIKELQAMFQILIESIFGVSSSFSGWNLRRISRYESSDDFEALYRFLHPQGALFDIAYKLLGDVYLKYEYNIAYLPPCFRQLIEQGNVPPFYMEKMNIDPSTGEPRSLHLNSFELYMFHFAFHLVSPWHLRPDLPPNAPHETVYLHLSDTYLAQFLPIETSAVLPVVLAHQTSPRLPPPQVQPVKVSKLFKASALKHILAATASPVVTQPHAEIWRSESLLHIIIYFWLYVPEPNRSFDSKRQDWQEMRPSGDHLRVVRNLIKHMHYFGNNVRNDSSAMDEMRRSIRNVLQRPLYSFLRHNIHHWPLDSSFLLMLETYLSYIQPWRYQRYTSTTQAGLSTNVTSVWAPFISDNLEAYTAIIAELISRFARMDLSSPRHANMVYRLSKVVAEPDLPNLLYQADCAAQNRGDQDGHVSLFTSATERLVTELLRNMRATAALVTAQEKAAHEQKSSSFLETVREWVMGSSSEDYSSKDRQMTMAYLDHSVQWLSSIFGVEAPDPPPEPGATASVQPSLLDPLLAHKRAGLFKYGGNPDLQPIRSTECASLVRFYHRISSSINEVHGPQIAELWYQGNLKGRVARQLLAPPCHTHFFHKTGPGNPAPRVTTMLPPRVCLRPLASHRVLFLVAIVAFAPYLFNYSPPVFYLCSAIVYVVILLIKATVAPYFDKDPSQADHEPFLPLDISFNE